MKKQIIFTIIMGIFIALFIYKITYHNETKILALGDSLALGMTYYNVEGYSFNDYLRDYFEDSSILREYLPDFSDPNETTKTLINKVDNNEQLKTTNLTIQRAIKEATIITLAIGTEELNNLKEIKSVTVDNYLNNMEKILKKIRIFNNKEVFVIGLYPSSKLSKELVIKINNELSKISETNNCKFIDITTISANSNYIFNPKSIYLNYRAHRYISELIITNLS